MIELIAEIQKVELVGGEGWLEHNFVAVAAITAAVVAATVSILNRRAQLKHDREMRNRDHQRDALDSAATMIVDVHKALSELTTSASKLDDQREQLMALEDEGEEREELEERIEDVVAHAKRKLLEANEIVSKATSTRVPIGLRFGVAAHPVARTYLKAVDAQRKRRDALAVGVAQARTQAQKDAVKEANDQGRATFSAFMIACETWLGTIEVKVP